MRQRFTGYHATAILVGFFAIVIAVNLTMARLATSTFGGALAENGYVASQDYNHWIAESAAQDRLGWDVAARVEDRRLILYTKGVSNAVATVVAEHPLGRIDDRTIEMTTAGANRLRSTDSMPFGRWKLRITLKRGNSEAVYSREVRS
jgi:nitrogen fixation protein FixH